MAKLSTYKNIITSDFKKEDQDTIEQLGRTVNDAFNQLFFALNGRINFSDNLSCTLRTVDVTVDANGNPTARTTITLNNTLPVIGCMVLAASNQTNTSVYPTSAPFISFTQLNQSLLLNNITGLQANQRYTLTIVAFN